MKILFTGGGSGGHFYPIIAVAEALEAVIDREKIVSAKLYYMSDRPYDQKALFENGITYISITAGKRRTYRSLENFTDLFKTFFGIIGATIKMFAIYPDVVFSKGGYASFPAVVAARILRIPVVIHESDSVPGRVNAWSAKFAKKIAVSFDEAGQYFPKEKTAWTGQPIRQEISSGMKEGAFEYLKLDSSIPVITILGGSLGAELINNTVIDSLPVILNGYQVVHQTGTNNLTSVNDRVSIVLKDHPHADRYKSFGFLNPLALKMIAGASSLIISRAGSTLFEIASWGIPSIIVPITNTNGDHQRNNAFNYARSGACIVVEEANLTPTILCSEIERIFKTPSMLENMKKGTEAFARRDAAVAIANELVAIGLSHEQ